MFSDQRTRGNFHAGWFFLVSVIVLVVLTGYIAFDNNYAQVESVKVVLTGMDRAFDGYTILHISDLHGKRFGAQQRQLASALSKYHFDAVCISGDVTAADGDPYAFYELLDVLEPTKRPVLFIAGDNDPPALIGEPHYTNDVLAEFVTSAQRKGAIYVDAPQQISVNGKSIWIVPGWQLSLDVDATEARYRNQLRNDQEGGNANTPGIKARERLALYQLDMLEQLRSARERMQPGDLHLALVHFPLQADYLSTLQNTSLSSTTSGSKSQPLDLVLSGHYNGGQVRLPFAGPVYVPSSGTTGGRWFPGDKRTQGLSQNAGISQYISPGLGVSSAYSIPLRLFNSPKVTLIRLTTSLPPQ